MRELAKFLIKLCMYQESISFHDGVNVLSPDYEIVVSHQRSHYRVLSMQQKTPELSKQGK